MKKSLILLSLMLCILVFSACGRSETSILQNGASEKQETSLSAESTTITETDRDMSEKIANALAGSLMLGSSWDKITGEDFKYDLSLTTFYCILNPDYPAEIPAVEYEAFIQKYFDISAIELREIYDYNKENETYAVSVDISVERANKQTEEYFRIDQITYEDGQIKVSYHTIWGAMASTEDMQNSTVLAGYVVLDKDNDYRIVKVELTENANIYNPIEILTSQMDEIQAAVVATASASAQQIELVIAELGYPVIISHAAMPNYEQAVAFFEQSDELERFFTVFESTGYEHSAITGRLYGKDDTGFYKIQAYIWQDENSEWQSELGSKSDLLSLELTDDGCLLEDGYLAATGTGSGFGFRVIPLPAEYEEAYLKYVQPIDRGADGVLTSSWNESGLDKLPWEIIFDTLWANENPGSFVQPANPNYMTVTTKWGEDECAIASAELVESTLMGYFNVSEDSLRRMTRYSDNTEKLYIPSDNTYTIWGWFNRAGQTIPNVEVRGITTNQDGSITLDISTFPIEYGYEGVPHSLLSVMPLENGEFRYISNLLIG